MHFVADSSTYVRVRARVLEQFSIIVILYYCKLSRRVRPNITLQAALPITDLTLLKIVLNKTSHLIKLSP